MSAVAPARPRQAGPLSPPLRRAARAMVTAAAAAAVLEAFLAFVVAPLQGHFGGEFEDFEAYFDGGRAVAAGTNPYAGFDPGTVAMSGFDYPPLAAWLVRPIMVLPHHWAQTVWLWLALGSLVAGAVVAGRTLLPATWPRTRISLFSALVFAPAAYNLWHGQMNTVVFLLLALAMRDWVEGREVRCGVLLGAAAAIKVSPALLVLALLRRGWGRGAAAMLATGAASLLAGTALLGPAATATWFRSVLPTLGRDNGWIYNQTWNGTLSRLFDHSVLTVSPSWAWLKLAVVALGAVTLAVALRGIRGGERDAGERGAEFGAMVVAMLLVGSIAWFPHYVHLLLPLFAAAALLHRRGPGAERALAIALGGAVLVFAVLAPWAIATMPMDRIVSLSHTAAWWAALQLSSLPAIAAAGLLAGLAVALGRPAPEPAMSGPAPSRVDLLP